MPIPKRNLNRAGLCAWPADAFPEAPDDGKLYARVNLGWEEPVLPAPDEETAKALSAVTPQLWFVPEPEE